MKRIQPNAIYDGIPCSVVSVGCAMKLIDRAAIVRLYSNQLHKDGYLSLRDMDGLLRANMSVKRRTNYKRGQRPALWQWAQDHVGTKAVICLLGHFIYFDGHDYHSFFHNESDEVVTVWEVA